MLKLKKALLVVDVQNDFCPGGALGVKEGDAIIRVINKYIQAFAKQKLPVLVTRDWHPKKTKHFKQYGGLWPKHCLQGTEGAAFHPKLKIPKEAVIFSKGADPEKDSYSAFAALDHNNMELAFFLKMLGIRELYIAGLATDYCVKFTSLDALRNGFKIYVLTDAVKGVNLNPGDSEAAMKEMCAAGAKKLTLEKLSL